MRSFAEYTKKFYRLSAKNNLTKTEYQQVAQHIRGLKRENQDPISLHTMWDLSEAISLGTKLESQLKRNTTQLQFDG